MADGEAPAEAQEGQAAPQVAEQQQPQQAEEQQQTPDISEALASIERRFDGLESRLGEQEPEGEDDFLNSLGYPGGYDDDPAQQSQEQQAQEFTDPDEAAFNQLLDERVQQATQQIIGPIAQKMEMDRRADGLNKLAEQYPDLKTDEVLDPLTEKLEGFAESYGDAVMTDPRFVELAYKAVKAEAVAAAETPAEAVGQGNSLEQGAGPGAPATDESPEEVVAKALLGGGPGNDVVTGLGWGK